MTPPENGKPLWNETAVAALLEDFFQKEMPADLQSESPERPAQRPTGRRLPTASVPPSRPANPPASPNAPRRSIAGVLAIGFSSLMMVTVALLYWSEPPSEPQNRGPETMAGPQSGRSNDRNDGTHPAPDPADEAVDSLSHGGGGPVESRHTISPVGRGEPDEPAHFDFPELDIEVFPFDDLPKNPDESEEEHRLPEEESAPSEATPMPEEGVRLPESRRPEANDPDEADGPSLLPEQGAPPAEPPELF